MNIVKLQLEKKKAELRLKMLQKVTGGIFDLNRLIIITLIFHYRTSSRNPKTCDKLKLACPCI